MTHHQIIHKLHIREIYNQIHHIFKYTTSSNMLDSECNVPNSTLYACGTGFGYQRYVTDLSPIFKSHFKSD